MEALGLCHTVVADEKHDEDLGNYIAYNASSPDELALVNGARHLGFALESRDVEGNMYCRTKDGKIRLYKLLNVIEFDSTRKRMSVIVKTPEDKILVICKGADSVIEKLLRNDAYLEITKAYLDEFAKTGLRTLLIASKEISEADYNKFSSKYYKA